MLPTLVVALLPALAAVLYQPTATKSPLNNELTARDIVLFVTAHPDDECMFFAPTILGLQSIAQPPDIHVLSLSFGNADGLGETRHKEFQSSLDNLGIPEGHKHILDHPYVSLELQDNMTAKWNPEIISNLFPAMSKNQANIDQILTFDRKGVSGHANHKSIFHGVRRYAQSRTVPPKLYALISVPTLTKYTSILAPVQAKFDLYGIRLWRTVDTTALRVLRLIGLAEEEGKKIPLSNSMPVFVSGVNEFVTAHKAMRAHRSQLVWFRWLYVLFSRYMWVNEWQEIVT
ncbi:putative deacetylase LmbE-like domain-containing protein, partial [Mucidula mucida]